MSTKKLDLFEDIKMELGYPIVDVELNDNTFDKILSKSMRDLQPYILFTQYKTIDNGPVIELPEDVVYVMDIFREMPKGGSPLAAPNQLNDNELLFGATGQNSMLWDTGSLSGMGSGGLTNYYLMKLYYNSVRGNTASNDFTQNGNKLFIEKSMGGDKITIEYVPLIKEVDQLTDPYWFKQLYYIFLANCKIVIGRARSKYRIQSSKYELDGERILEEGLAEKAKIIEDLENSGLHLIQLIE